MSKNIVILFDGTSNEISGDRTNILRLYGTLKKSDKQLVWYDPGVGTIGRNGAWQGLWAKLGEFRGRVTGWGLDDNAKEAYRFLVETYDAGPVKSRKHIDRDQIYIIGFSRGAYSARVLAGFINAFGLMQARNLNLLDYAFRAYRRIASDPKRKAGDNDASFGEIRLYERTLRPDRPPIRLLGLFDTVSSVIESKGFGWKLGTHAYTYKNPSVETVRHALSVDERRTMFQPLLWPAGQEYWGGPFRHAGTARPQDMRELWFAGVHCDIGGGYPEAESGLAKVTLDWMIREIAPTGLHLNPKTVDDLVRGKDAEHDVGPDPLADAHDSMRGLWRVLEFIPRRASGKTRRSTLFGWYIPFFEHRVIPEGAKFHRSVETRMKGRDYHPPNVPDNPDFED